MALRKKPDCQKDSKKIGFCNVLHLFAISVLVLISAIFLIVLWSNHLFKPALLLLLLLVLNS